MTEKVVYFSGCYANYYDPRIGEAFVEVMETNGIEVLVAEGETLELMTLLSNWLREHMTEKDKEFGKYLKKCKELEVG